MGFNFTHSICHCCNKKKIVSIFVVFIGLFLVSPNGIEVSGGRVGLRSLASLYARALASGLNNDLDGLPILVRNNHKRPYVPLFGTSSSTTTVSPVQGGFSEVRSTPSTTTSISTSTSSTTTSSSSSTTSPTTTTTTTTTTPVPLLSYYPTTELSDRTASNGYSLQYRPLFVPRPVHSAHRPIQVIHLTNQLLKDPDRIDSPALTVLDSSNGIVVHKNLVLPARPHRPLTSSHDVKGQTQSQQNQQVAIGQIITSQGVKWPTSSATSSTLDSAASSTLPPYPFARPSSSMTLTSSSTIRPQFIPQHEQEGLPPQQVSNDVSDDDSWGVIKTTHSRPSPSSTTLTTTLSTTSKVPSALLDAIQQHIQQSHQQTQQQQQQQELHHDDQQELQLEETQQQQQQNVIHQQELDSFDATTTQKTICETTGQPVATLSSTTPLTVTKGGIKGQASNHVIVVTSSNNNKKGPFVTRKPSKVQTNGFVNAIWAPPLPSHLRPSTTSTTSTTASPMLVTLSPSASGQHLTLTSTSPAPMTFMQGLATVDTSPFTFMNLLRTVVFAAFVLFLPPVTLAAALINLALG